MNFIKPRFSHEKQAEFFKTLKNRVNNYFQENQLSMSGGQKMIGKIIFMFTLYLTPFILIFTPLASATWLYLGLWILMGLGMSGIGLAIMHDANHGALSGNKRVNTILSYTMDLIGSNSFIWRMQHNVLHHSFTNIDGADPDIDMQVILRFSPHQKHYWFHRFQHIYGPFLYGFMTLLRVFVTDFSRLKAYRNIKLVSEKVFRKELRKTIQWKVFYILYILVIPMLFAPQSMWITVLGFVVMHFLCSQILAFIFQTAHVMPSCEYPVMDEKGNIENSWAIHEIATTTNFSPRSRWFSWLIGGLNYQVEHHLFANISHIHYRELHKIVKQTADEFGIKVNMEKNFLIAVWNHLRLLRDLGKLQPVRVKP